MEGAGIQELEKILQVRGGKKADFPQLVKSIEAKNIWLAFIWMEYFFGNISLFELKQKFIQNINYEEIISVIDDEFVLIH